MNFPFTYLRRKESLVEVLLTYSIGKEVQAEISDHGYTDELFSHEVYAQVELNEQLARLDLISIDCCVGVPWNFFVGGILQIR